MWKLIRRLDSVTTELQTAALRMRMQPAGFLFERFPRMVRDLARQLGKQIEISDRFLSAPERPGRLDRPQTRNLR